MESEILPIIEATFFMDYKSLRENWFSQVMVI